MNSESLLQAFQTLIYQRFGIHYSHEKIFVLKSKLQRLERRMEFGTLEDFYHEVQRRDPGAEDILLTEITVNHTFFFRESSHFDAMIQEIRKKNLYSPALWCAASSTGEEPYSLAISLLEAGVRNFLILCSDLDPEVLQVMHRGTYPPERMNQMPGALKTKYFKPAPGGLFKIRPDLRGFLKIRRLNLLEPLHFEQEFDFVFCRNVMIYFDDAGRRRVVDNLVQNLRSGGTLFVGHTEALLNTPDSLKKTGQSQFLKV